VSPPRILAVAAVAFVAMNHRDALPPLEDLHDRPRRVLAVFPHPDDESYGCAGALAREGAREDAAAVLMCLTRGEASSMGRERGLTPDQVGALREERLRQVEEIVGLDALLLPGFPDGRLARCSLDEVSAAIGAAIDAFRPQVVIGHDPRGVNGHSDHIASHWALRHALLERPGTRFAMIVYTQETCDAVRPRLLFPTRPEEIDAELRLSPAEADRKEACLRVHEALVTLRDDGPPELLRRPPVERFDFLGEDRTPPAADLFDGLDDSA
jgi:LmbE family N-acetylglucosaminyl deacetylase